MKIKILFICGSLEPGCDGVGDYTRRLAGELIRQGHEVALLALNDPYISNITNELQEAEEVTVSVLRLPNFLENEHGFKAAKRFLAEMNPGWISLQFVPFAFQKKGLPYQLAVKLAAIEGSEKWHIMFHELWVGNENFKNRILSFLQKKLIKSLLKRLKPQVVHTHLPIYYRQLEGLGQRVQSLPLFSNIPVTENSVEKSKETFTIGFFSQASASEEILAFITALYKQLVQIKKRIRIVFIGGAVDKMKEIGKVIEQQPGFENQVTYTGYLTPPEISSYLQICDLGITSLPLRTLGKSGSVAAFLAHQIPIAVPNTHYRGVSISEAPFFKVDVSEALLLEADLSKLAKAKRAAILANEYSNLELITKKFLTDLN